MAGCEHELDSVPPSQRSPLPESAALPSGKSDLALETGHEYRSPPGFEPVLRFEVDEDGWVSTHRRADGFDMSRPSPSADAPIVVVAVITPPEASLVEAFRALKMRARAAGGRVEGPPSNLRTSVHVEGGQGPLVLSRDGGIALDAVPEGDIRVELGEIDGSPWLVVTWTPDADERFDGAEPRFEPNP